MVQLVVSCTIFVLRVRIVYETLRYATIQIIQVSANSGGKWITSSEYILIKLRINKEDPDSAQNRLTSPLIHKEKCQV